MERILFELRVYMFWEKYSITMEVIERKQFLGWCVRIKMKMMKTWLLWWTKKLSDSLKYKDILLTNVHDITSYIYGEKCI